MATKLSTLRTNFKHWAKDQSIGNTEIDFWINQIYLSISGKFKGTHIMEDYATEETVSIYNEDKPYIKIIASGLIGWNLHNNQSTDLEKTGDKYKIYLEKGGLAQIIYTYYEPDELTDPNDTTIFTNKASDNVLVMYAVAEYFDSIYIPEQGQLLRNKAQTIIWEIGEKSEDQKFIISSNNYENQEPNIG